MLFEINLDKEFLNRLNSFEWNYKRLPINNSKVLIKYYKNEGYSTAIYSVISNTLDVMQGTELLILGKHFKKWSHI
jgi:hypothetical protein